MTGDPDDLLDADPELLALIGASEGAVRPSASLRETLLRAVSSDDAVDRFAGFADRMMRLYDLSEAAVRDVFARIGKADVWEPYIDGVSLQHFTAGPRVLATSASQIDAGIVRFGAGLSYPRHRHHGDEYMLILSGGLVEDESGRTAIEGDMLHMAADTEHGFKIMADRDCIAAVLLFNGLPDFV